MLAFGEAESRVIMATVRKEATTTTCLTFEIEIDEAKYGKKATQREFVKLAERYAKGDGDIEGAWFNPLKETVSVEEIA